MMNANPYSVQEFGLDTSYHLKDTTCGSEMLSLWYQAVLNSFLAENSELILVLRYVFTLTAGKMENPIK